MTSIGNSRSDFIPEQSASSLTYGRGGGCFVTRWRAAIFAAVVITVIVLAAAFGRYVWAAGPNRFGIPFKTSGVGEAESKAGADAGAEEGQRLPPGLVPLRYRLHMWPVLATLPPSRDNFTFQGRVAVTVRVTSEEGTDRIVLHAASALAVSEEDVVVVEASPLADALANSWDLFPVDTPLPLPLQRSARHIPAQGSTHNPGARGLFAGNSTLERVPVKAVNRTAAWDLLELTTVRRLLKDGVYTIFLRFNGTLGDSLNGFYRSSYFDTETQDKRWLAATQMQPTYAREAFPCMDEPAYRARFRVSLACAEGTSAIANAPLNSTAAIPSAPGWKWYHFEETVPMPTYLIAFAVTDFSFIVPTVEQFSRDANQSLTQSSGLGLDSQAPTNATTPSPVTNNTFPGGRKVEVRLWARPNALQRGRYAVDLTPKILDYYAQYFSVPYPLTKIDLLAIPDFHLAAMENWGLVVFREIHLLVDKETDGVHAVQRVAETVAHELAHQWFGNLVTPAWWDEIWLNEGFAEYVQFLAVDHVEPSWNVTASFQYAVLQPALRVDSSEASRAIAARMRSEHDIVQAFDSITYDKGACLVRMLHHSLGKNVFRRGVSKYLKTWQHNSTTESRLWEPLTEAVGQVTAADPWHKRLPENTTVAAIMAAWTQSTGYPVVNVTRDRTNAKITFTQERFLDRGWERNCTRKFSGPQLWYVPLSMVTRGEAEKNASALEDTRPRAWLVNRTLEMPDAATPEEWVVVNLEQTGFYRVNYDLENWRLLAEQLRSDHRALSPGVRAQLLGDAFSLAHAGQLPYPAALRLTTYLAGSERASRPWRAVLDGLDSIYSALTGHPDLVLLERYMRRLLQPMWEYVAPPDPSFPSAPAAPGAPGAASLRHETLLLRVEIASWACRVHVEECVTWAQRAVHVWRMQPDPDSVNPVPVMLRGVAYCAAVRSGSSEVWNFMWKRYLAARRDRAGFQHQSVILATLACTSEPARAAYLLARSLEDDDIRQQDASSVWMSAGMEPVARLITFRLLRDNWAAIHRRFGSDSVVSTAVVTAATLSLSSEADLKDLEAFRSEHNATLGAVSRTLESSTEDLRTAIQWRRKHLPAVRSWLQAELDLS